VTQDTAGESPLTSNSQPPGSPLSSLSESTSEVSESNQRGAVSKTMREEERKMRTASTEEEENRIRPTNNELEDKVGTNGRVFDERLSNLERLLSQSQVRSPMLCVGSAKPDCAN